MEGITSPPDATNSNASSVFSPLLISMLGIAATSLAIIVYHFFLVKYCIRRHQTTAAQPAISHPPIATGVDKNVLDTIPIFAFSVLKRDEFGVDQEECVVCLGELKDDDMVRCLPNCKHAFHVPCIDQWFAAHTSCPLCRSPPILVRGKDDEFSISVASARVSSSRHENIVSNQNCCDEIASPRVQSSGLLRHCSSLNLPAVDKKSSSGLKRSLSMDQSFVVINLQKEKEAINSSSTSSSSSSGSGKFRRSESYRTRSLSHFDRVSSKLLSSFSRLRVGKGKGNVDPILPY